MGLSSRPYTEINKTEEAIDFFVESIEHWRKALNLTDLVLIGHSFGAYMSFHYTKKYSGHVNRLILLSPVGFTDFDKSISSMTP